MRRIRVFHLLGITLLIIAVAMILASLWSLGDRGADRTAFLWSILVTAGVGAALCLIFLPARHSRLSLVESFSLVALAWLAAGLFGALPYYFYGVFPGGYVDAFFESVSGFTTTGATLISDIESLPRGLLFWRSLTQWLGGMGIVVLFLAVMPRFGFKGLTAFRAELPGPMADRVLPRVVETARRLWLIYVALTVLQASLLKLSGLGAYDALSHALTTMPTGGFSTYNASIAALNNPMAEIIIIIFMVAAGVNFALYFGLLRGDFKVFKNQEFKFYLAVIAVALTLVALNLTYQGGGEHLPTTIRESAFQVVSITTTTGYATANFDAWPYFSRALLFFLMFLGGCGGSTGGAMKQIRLMLMVKYALRELNRMVHPSAVSSVKIGGQVFPEDALRGVMGFSFLYIFFFVGSTLILSGMGLDFTTSSSAVAATLGNVGPGLGLVGPLHTYEAIPVAGRTLLTVMMILGRLEIYTVLILFLPEARRHLSSKVTGQFKGA